ncbi:MAG TPA: DUF2867 domain-containing protein, partial [Acidimicrobiales bacterium]|nr:DUF2867 domain-containing protein [Acidimicrobiales bacterium]
GGMGLRRGRRHPADRGVGDALDSWRVGVVDPPRLLRLRAEMRLPGEAWIEWRVEDDGRGGSILHQRALFHPRGLWGRLYWYGVLPFHTLIFRPLCRRLAEAAARTTAPAAREAA